MKNDRHQGNWVARGRFRIEGIKTGEVVALPDRGRIGDTFPREGARHYRAIIGEGLPIDVERPKDARSILQFSHMNDQHKKSLVVWVLACVFLVLGISFVCELWGRPGVIPAIPLVDLAFIDTATARKSYSDLKSAGADLSDFDCYGCHEKKKPPVLRFDNDHNLIIPKEHESIVMGHGRHNRNNNCYNCHDEQNLEQLQTRDGRALSFADSTPLCGSCHGPTYRDWEAGAHGRTSGAWNHETGAFKRQNCVSCHNPHSPKFPGRHPAPGPHPLRPQETTLATATKAH